MAFPSLEVLPQNDKVFFVPGESDGLGLSEGKREQRRPGRDDDVLPAVEPVGDRRGIDSRAQLDMPQIRSRAPIEGNEITVGVAGKNKPTRGGERSAVGIAEVLKLPLLHARRRVERLERAAGSYHGVRHVDTSQKVMAHA